MFSEILKSYVHCLHCLMLYIYQTMLIVFTCFFQTPFNIFGFHIAGYFPDANFFQIETNTGIVRLSQNINLDSRENYVVSLASTITHVVMVI